MISEPVCADCLRFQFSCGDGAQQKPTIEHLKFMREILPLLDAADYVFRYNPRITCVQSSSAVPKVCTKCEMAKAILNLMCAGGRNTRYSWMSVHDGRGTADTDLCSSFFPFSVENHP